MPHSTIATLRVAALTGLLAVALGAFGAHGLKTHWDATLTAADAAYRLDTWKTASVYHMVHAVVLLALALARVSPGASRSFFYGLIIFSGSLYTLSLTGMKWLGAITPIGGLLLMLGWLLLALPQKKSGTGG
jgi:uncharacterized membrane protein YgdD (TMEM256/DUF423 family)